MPWSLNADGFFDYMPSLAGTAPRTKFFFVANSGFNTGANAGVPNDWTKPYRSCADFYTFTVASPVSVTIGTQYMTPGGQYFLVGKTDTNTKLMMYGYLPTPSSPGVLNKSSGAAGDPATINFTNCVQEPGAFRAAYNDVGGGASAHIILIKRGDYFGCDAFTRQWKDGIESYGISAAEPFVVGCYDPSQLTSGNAWGTFPTINPKTSALAKPRFEKNGFETFFSTAGGFTPGFGDRMVFVGLDICTDGTSSFLALRPNRFIRWEDIKFSSSNSLPIGQTLNSNGNGQHFHRCMGIDGAGLITGGHSLSLIAPDAFYRDGGLYTAMFTECFFDHNGDTSDPSFTRGHTWYLSCETIPACRGRGDTGRYYLQGNIISRDPSSAVQFRPGGLADNNCWILCAAPLSGTGAINVNSHTKITNNVCLHSLNIPTSGNGDFLSSFKSYQGYYFHKGDVLWDNNIAASSDDITGDALYIVYGGARVTWTNSLVYKHATSSPANAMLIQFSSGVTGNDVAAADIVGGSGWTDNSFPVATRNTNDYNGTKYAIVTLGAPFSFAANFPWGGDGSNDNTRDHNGTGWVYVDGFTGDWANLNGKAYACIADLDGRNAGIPNSIILGNAFPSGSTGVSGGGTLYFPYVRRSLTPVAGHGSATAPCRADIIVAHGAIVHVHMAGSESDLGGPTFGEPGAGWAVGDWATTAQTDPSNIAPSNSIPNGGSPTPWHFVVRDIESATPATVVIGAPDAYGNLLDPLGAYINPRSGPGQQFPDPGRNAATYLDFLLGLPRGTSTALDFVNACRAKWSRQTWDDLYTAYSLDDYVREGDGKPFVPLWDGSASGYARLVGGGGGLIVVSPSALPSGTVGKPYSQTISASGGTAPYTFAVTSGTLPAGLSLTSAGVLSGTPTTAAISNFSVTATDSAGRSGTLIFDKLLDARRDGESKEVRVNGKDEPSQQSAGSRSYSLTVAAASGPGAVFLRYRKA